MERPPVQEIINSLENCNILALRDLAEALSEKYVSVTVIDEAEIRRREEAARAYWTPYYALILVRVDPNAPHKVALIKKLREISYCSLAEGKELVENPDKLPFTVWKRYHIHPNEARETLRSLREELEALGASFEEDYHLGYFD